MSAGPNHRFGADVCDFKLHRQAFASDLTIAPHSIVRAQPSPDVAKARASPAESAGRHARDDRDLSDLREASNDLVRQQLPNGPLFRFGAGYAEGYDCDGWLYPKIYAEGILTGHGYWRSCTIGAHGIASHPNGVLTKVLDVCIQSIDQGIADLVRHEQM